jgi:hypothetical protein
VNAAISWGAPGTLRRRGKHRLTLKQRLMRWNERTAEELRRARPKHNAGKAARTAMMLIPVGAMAATLHNPLTWPVYMATCALWVPAAAIGMSW